MERDAAAPAFDADRGENVLMPAVESVGDAENGGERLHDLLVAFGQRGKTFVLGFGMAFPVVAGDVGDDLDFPVRKSEKFAVPDEVVAVLVVLRMRDVVPDVMDRITSYNVCYTKLLR